MFIKKRDYIALKHKISGLEARVNSNARTTADNLFALSTSIFELQDRLGEIREYMEEFSTESEQSLKLEREFLLGLNGIMTYGVENGRKE